MLKTSATGFAWLALSALTQERAFGATVRPHFPAKAKSVVFLFMDGGVSHVDTFDPKPALAAHAGQPWSGDAARKWLKSPWNFAQHGQSGTWVSELFPHLATCVDDIAVIRSMKADLPIHSTGVLLLHTGHNLAGRPSLGSWMSYGLGSENENLPGYVVLSFGHVPVGGMEAFGSGFLPANYEATIIRAEGAPVDNIVPAASPAQQEAKLRFLRRQDGEFAARLGGNDAVESAVRNYELAARMQLLVPDVLDGIHLQQPRMDLRWSDRLRVPAEAGQHRAALARLNGLLPRGFNFGGHRFSPLNPGQLRRTAGPGRRLLRPWRPAARCPGSVRFLRRCWTRSRTPSKVGSPSSSASTGTSTTSRFSEAGILDSRK
jgi:hypothetical protein